MIVNVGDVRDVHYAEKPPSAQYPQGQAESTVKVLQVEFYAESSLKLGDAAPTLINDYRKFEPQVKWCLELFDLIDAMAKAEGNDQAIYGHRVKLWRVDKPRPGGGYYGNLKASDLGKTPAHHPVMGNAPAPQTTTAAPAAPIGDVAAACGNAFAAALNITDLKNALRMKWADAKQAGVTDDVMTRYTARKSLLLSTALLSAADTESLTVAWNEAFAETEKDLPMRNVLEAACIKRQEGIAAGLPPSAVAADDIPF